MGKYLLSSNERYFEKLKVFEAISKKEEMLKKEIDSLNVSLLEKNYRKLWKAQFEDLSIKEADVVLAEKTYNNTKAREEKLLEQLEEVRQLKIDANDGLKSIREEAEHAMYLEARKDYAPLFLKIFDNLKELSSLHGQVRKIITELQEGGMSGRTQSSVEIIFLFTASFDPGKLDEDSALRAIEKHGREYGFWGK